MLLKRMFTEMAVTAALIAGSAAGLRHSFRFQANRDSMIPKFLPALLGMALGAMATVAAAQGKVAIGYRYQEQYP